MEINSKYGYDTSKTSTFNFYGLNRTRRGTRGEFSDMKNMGTLEYPCAAPRGKRENVVTVNDVIDAVAAPDRTTTDSVDGLTGISGGAFYYNGEIKSGNENLPSDFSWEIIRMGNLYIINGFKRGETKESYSTVLYYYNIDNDTFSSAAKSMGNLILIAGKNSTGNYLATIRYGYDTVVDYTASDGEGTVIKNSDFFYEYTGGGGPIPSSNIFEKVFSVGDEVTIEGFPTREENFGQVWSYLTSQGEVIPQTEQDFSLNNTVDTDAYANLTDIHTSRITKAVIDSFAQTSMVVEGNTTYTHYVYLKLYNRDGDEIDFDEMSGTTNFYCSGVTLAKRIRRFDNITTHLGRVWGTTPSGNQIYGGASDDLFDFSSDSITKHYAVRIPSDTPGGFTGLCEYGGELITFKEDNITIIGGGSVESLYTHTIYGVGCIDAKSIAVTQSGVIFLSHTGFQIFTGNTPSCISSKLKTKYKSAVAGFDGNIYYASAERADGTYEFLTYDMRYGTWHVQDNIKATGFFRFLERFYFASDNTVYLCDSESDGLSAVTWSFTSTVTHDNTLDKKALNEIWIRAELEEGSYFTLFTKIDDDEWRTHSAFSKPGLNVFRCPIRAVSGCHYQYRITGGGNVVFYEIELHRNYEDGRRYKEQDGTETGKPVLKTELESYAGGESGYMEEY